MRVTILVLVTSLLAGAAPDARQRVRASIDLVSSQVQLTQTSDTAWTLDKTGLVDRANATVTWQITATQGATTAGLLIVNGVLQVRNSGGQDAPIGNILVNLQTRQGGHWVTVATNVADATADDAATTAQIAPMASSEFLGTFTENAASGQLLFMDAASNSLFALAPQRTIAQGTTVTLLVSATFKNHVLGLAAGTLVRAEIIVSFGNAKPSGQATAANLDISGNGAIDATEDWVRSVPVRHTLTVPPQVPSNSEVEIRDTEDDIMSTGTVTFSNPVIVLGATSATVTVTYDGGTDGGTITNCAQLTGEGQSVTSGGFTFPNVGGVDLEACNTQVIGPPGARGWEDGDLVTYTQTAWGDPAHPAGQLLSAHYNSVYFDSGGVLVVGVTGVAGFSMIFTSATAVLHHLPSVGAVGSLNADLVDPTTTSSGAFGGEVVALELNVAFADEGHTRSTTGLRLGDLALCNFTTFTDLNGMSVRDFLALANTGLGGGATPLSVADLHTVAQQLNGSFGGGAVSLFAQQHLCRPDVITFTQVDWGDPAHPGGQLLSAQFDSVYGAAGAFVEIGIAGPTGFSIIFSNAVAILAYLPSVGAVGPLNADLLNPLTTSAGAFGGEVVSLTLNVDFADAGHTFGGSGMPFGDLTLCNFSTFTVLNGMSVRGFVQMAHTALGGGVTPLPLADIHDVAENVNGAFSNGSASLFAQQHLFNGACPP